ncbi:putative methyltransferase-domain-containing protein [Microdochium trichocladiopsis]|uniref:Protein-lysine N-methyltransferase EFM6 n=1 Tax=Microdochium trichocladiopsis TaxID=1682393 RepID=A0A9P8Y3B2_9PEZI|nr:putative methyltransferase-domain-containing protein [Microdochium trichocladiopsis]KAH7026393.1 putative methyltransferase-domain-containing protein [Microdochium trichocladiopsis]
MLAEDAAPPFEALDIDLDLAPLPAMKAAGTANFDFSGLLSQPLRLHEDLANGCGGQTWPAGFVLGKHMLRYHHSDLQDARILELGAGGGLVGLAVARGCTIGHPLYVTDQIEMFDLMGKNIGLNGLEAKVKAAILNWGDALSQEIIDFKPNVILAADCVYFEPAFPLLLATMTDLLALCPSATIYFCFKKRRRADMHFLKKAQKKFNVVELVDEDRPVFSREGLFLFGITAKAQASQSQKVTP